MFSTKRTFKTLIVNLLTSALLLGFAVLPVSADPIGLPPNQNITPYFSDIITENDAIIRGSIRTDKKGVEDWAQSYLGDKFPEAINDSWQNNALNDAFAVFAQAYGQFFEDNNLPSDITSLMFGALNLGSEADFLADLATSSQVVSDQSLIVQGRLMAGISHFLESVYVYGSLTIPNGHILSKLTLADTAFIDTLISSTSKFNTVDAEFVDAHMTDLANSKTTNLFTQFISSQVPIGYDLGPEYAAYHTTQTDNIPVTVLDEEGLKINNDLRVEGNVLGDVSGNVKVDDNLKLGGTISHINEGDGGNYRIFVQSAMKFVKGIQTPSISNPDPGDIKFWDDIDLNGNEIVNEAQGVSPVLVNDDLSVTGNVNFNDMALSLDSGGDAWIQGTADGITVSAVGSSKDDIEFIASDDFIVRGSDIILDGYTQLKVFALGFATPYEQMPKSSYNKYSDTYNYFYSCPDGYYPISCYPLDIEDKLALKRTIPFGNQCIATLVHREGYPGEYTNGTVKTTNGHLRMGASCLFDPTN